MKIELKLITSRPGTEEGFPLVFEISHKGKRKQKVIAHCKPEHFIKDHKMISSKHPDFDVLNPIILDYKITAKKIVLANEQDIDKAYKLLFESELKEPTFAQFGKNLVAEIKEEIAAFEKYKNIIARNKAAGNLAVYENVLRQFAPYVLNSKISEIDYNLLMEFRSQKLKENTSKATVYLYLRTLRAIYNKAILKCGLIDNKPFTGVFDNLKTKSFNSKKKYITIEDIKKLENYTGPKLKQEAVDFFLLQFYLGGADLIDVYYLKKKQCLENRIFFERGKTNNNFYIELLVHEKAARIFEKYYKKGEFLFPFRKDVAGYRTFRTRYARKLNEVAEELGIKVLPMGDKLGVKVVRHTFANRAKNLMLDPDLIRELMGHQRDDVDNFYKDRFPEKIRDEALSRIID